MYDTKAHHDAATILITDDDTVIRLMLQKLLEDQGHNIILAENGEEGVLKFQQHHPDLVLMDAAMPILDGFSACAKIKSLPGGDKTHILMITALYDDNSVDQAFAAGAMEYITKPIHLAALRHRVNTLLRALRAERELEISEARFRGVFQYAASGIALVDPQGITMDSNPALSRILGQVEEHLKGCMFSDFFQSSNEKIERDFHQQLLHGERESYQLEKYFYAQNDEIRWVALTVSAVRNKEKAGAVEFLVYLVDDVTRRKAAQIKQRMAMKVFENTNDGVMITNPEGKITYVNHAFSVVTGYSYGEVLDQTPSILKSGRHDAAFYLAMWDSINNTGRWRGEIWNNRKDGSFYSEWLSVSAVRDDLNQIVNYVGVFSDITALQGSEDHVKRLLHYDERIYRLTRYDVLTELPNRLLFHERLTQACRDGEQLALLCIDLDGFTQINEKFGYDGGDKVLKEVASRLKQCVNDDSAVARLENDEFAVILTPLSQTHEAYALAEKIFSVLSNPLHEGNQQIALNTHIGISLYQGECHTPEEAGRQVEHLFQRAELGMYLAKEQGINRYKCYQENEEVPV